MSRPLMLNDDRTEAIVSALRAGSPIETAARYGGISPATYYAWCARGREALEGAAAYDPPDEAALAKLTKTRIHELLAEHGIVHVPGLTKAELVPWAARHLAERADGVPPPERPFVEFLEAVTRARDSAEVDMVARVTNAARGGDWKAAAWFLERSRPETWGRQTRVEHSGRGGGPMVVAGVELPEEAGEAAAEAAHALLTALAGEG